MKGEIATFLWLTLVAPPDVTYEYQVHPFHPEGWPSDEVLETWLDDLGTQGFSAILVWLNDPFDASDDERFFVRPIGGPVQVINYGTERFRAPLSPGLEFWAEYDRLGAEGKLPVDLYERAGEDRVVTAAYTVDGERQIWGWSTESIGRLQAAGIADYKRAAKRLARNGYAPVIVSSASDPRGAFLVGFGNKTPGRRVKVKLRFKTVPGQLSPGAFERLINRQGRKGFRLADWAFYGDRVNARLVFAKETVNGRKTRHECIVEGYSASEPATAILSLLNSRGEQGFEFRGGYPLGAGLSPYLLLCDPD